MICQSDVFARDLMNAIVAADDSFFHSCRRRRRRRFMKTPDTVFVL
jgi:hypothetical protein